MPGIAELKLVTKRRGHYTDTEIAVTGRRRQAPP